MEKPIETAADIAANVLAPTNLSQVAAIAAAIGLGLWTARLLRALITPAGAPEELRGRLHEVAWVAAPYATVLLIMAAADGLMHAVGTPAQLVTIGVQLGALLLFIRVIVYLIRVWMGARARLKGWGTPISFVAWTFLSLHLLGWGDTVVELLDGIGINAGRTRISVWSVMKLLVTVSLFVMIAMWMARWLERRLLKLDALAPNMRIGIAKFAQAFLVALSVLVGLNAAGLDLTTLNVLTGAIGIGLGFGLQSIAANFVSGFVLLMDRSIKPGDVISFAGNTGTTTDAFGWVQELRGRYVVVRDRDGIEMLVPNQQLITNTVINWSYTDSRVRLKLPVQVAYESDPELAMQLLIQATNDHPRIVRDPGPVARLMGFGNSGINLELRFWIPDPQEGVNNVRSDVNRTIWRLFKEHGIVIPYPRGDFRIEMVPSQSAALGRPDYD
jgi:small-conductance mechanosensitive channel